MEFPKRGQVAFANIQTGPFQCLPNECLPTEFNTALDYSEGFIEGQIQGAISCHLRTEPAGFCGFSEQ
jgi:hypothetical protein